MTEDIKRQLEGMLEDNVEGALDFTQRMIIDLRKMEVRYICLATGNESVCKYFSPNGSRESCSHRGENGECFTYERKGN